MRRGAPKRMKVGGEGVLPSLRAAHSGPERSATEVLFHKKPGVLKTLPSLPSCQPSQTCSSWPLPSEKTLPWKPSYRAPPSTPPSALSSARSELYDPRRKCATSYPPFGREPGGVPLLDAVPHGAE